LSLACTWTRNRYSRLAWTDEIDCLLGKRDSQTEHESMRKIKNEFMALWDGLTTKSNERVIVLAATNRPFDLDDAVLRRLPRVCALWQR
jgi:SpoVK/Ycf46/Vps4 family AAA+-type ATPase